MSQPLSSKSVQNTSPFRAVHMSEVFAAPRLRKRRGVGIAGRRPSRAIPIAARPFQPSLAEGEVAMESSG